MTNLDLLKHVAKTIINALDENDRFSLVTFSDDPVVQVPLKHMTE